MDLAPVDFAVAAVVLGLVLVALVVAGQDT